MMSAERVVLNITDTVGKMYSVTGCTAVCAVL